MLLTIAIPTYNRSAKLDETLNRLFKLIIDSKFKKEIILFVSNNGSNDDTSDNFNDVSKVVSSVLKNNPSHNFDLVDIKQGDNSVTPIKNIYGAIKENTINSDIAIIHCDDDLMLPNTLLNRYLAAKTSDFEIIVSKFLESAYFFENDENIYLPKRF